MCMQIKEFISNVEKLKFVTKKCLYFFIPKTKLDLYAATITFCGIDGVSKEALYFNQRHNKTWHNKIMFQKRILHFIPIEFGIEAFGLLVLLFRSNSNIFFFHSSHTLCMHICEPIKF